jgi:hypothetical protein
MANPTQLLFEAEIRPSALWTNAGTQNVSDNTRTANIQIFGDVRATFRDVFHRYAQDTTRTTAIQIQMNTETRPPYHADIWWNNTRGNQFLCFSLSYNVRQEIRHRLQAEFPNLRQGNPALGHLYIYASDVTYETDGIDCFIFSKTRLI